MGKRVKIAASVREPDAWHEIEYKGEAYRIPPNPNLEALECMASGDVGGFVRHLVSETPGQWVKFRDAFSTDDLDPLAEALETLYGDGPGESEASGDT